MSLADEDREREEQTLAYLQSFFHAGSPASSPHPRMRDHTTLTRRNEPEFHADAPWRIGVEGDEIPLLFIIRDANLRPPARGPWRMESLRIDQELPGDQWHEIRSYTAAKLPDIASDGTIKNGFWVFRTRIPVKLPAGLDPVERGETVHLRITFEGSFPADTEPGPHPVQRYLKIYIARDPLPMKHTAGSAEPRHWFYGDTHYHSAFTNDIWEFGNPVRDARYAGMAIGLDWLIVTDHSCDLDERDDGATSTTRWERLHQELSRWSVSDHRFRCILGEEITVRNGRMSYLHLLAIGKLHRLIEGGFWSNEDHLVKQVANKLMEVIAAKGGYPADVVERLFGKVHTFEDALNELPPKTLAFAAHPQTAAQPPFVNGTWAKSQLTHPRLTGYEFWNGRSRRKTRILAGPTDNPFKEPQWNDPAQATKADTIRIKKLKQWAEERWDPVLQQGVDAWQTPDGPPASKPVFIGGTDAHGDFNYSVGVGWNYQQHGLISDNALGRVRTVVHLPDHMSPRVPPIREILGAMRKGACVVTDGPVLELSLRQGSHTAYMGEVLRIEGAGQPEATITVHTTPEFGLAEHVEVLVYMAGDKSNRQTTMTVDIGTSASVQAEGCRGYCRAMVQTTGPDGERFCCFTNPVWFWNLDDQPLRLQVRVQPGPR